MWLNQFKIALIEKNTDKLDLLMEDLPSFSDPKDIEQALYLLQEATTLVQELKDKTNASMQIMRKNISFLDATQDVSSQRFNCCT